MATLPELLTGVPSLDMVMSGNDKTVARPTLGRFPLCAIVVHKFRAALIFLPLVTFRRRKFLCEPDNVELLRAAFRTVKSAHPFIIDAFVLLPEHLHCIWTLPPGDKDYPMRWNAIKNHFTCHCPDRYKSPPSLSQQRKRAQTVWQPRYWEHQIRDNLDFEKHCDYIHWNPVKHGLASHPGDWPYSSFHNFVRRGIYPSDWTVITEAVEGDAYGE